MLLFVRLSYIYFRLSNEYSWEKVSFLGRKSLISVETWTTNRRINAEIFTIWVAGTKCFPVHGTGIFVLTCSAQANVLNNIWCKN